MPQILVVEDESIVALDIQSRLQNLGYQVPVTVGNGEGAIEKVETQQPDLVLMDIMLQGDLDGVQTAERIGQRFDIPIIFLTAYSDESTLQRAKATNPFGYLLKPFNDRELHTTIEIALTKHQSEKKLQQAHDQLELRVEERTGQLAQANEDLQRRFGQMQAIYQLSDAVARTEAVEGIYQEALNVVERLQQGDAAAIRLSDDNGVMRFETWRGLSDSYCTTTEPHTYWPADQSDPQPVLIASLERQLADHPLYLPTRFRCCNGIQAMAWMPLQHRNRVLGEFAIYYRSAHEFDDGEVELLQTIARHISFALARHLASQERAALEQQLHQSQKMEALGLLAGGVAHDFNNMLTIITGYGELVLNCMGEQDPLYRDVMAIKEAGERASILTSQLLAFGRKQVMQPKLLDLNNVVGKMQDMLRRELSEDIALVSIMGPGPKLVKADPGHLEQVLMNLVVNARDAMTRGGKLTIETSETELEEDYTRRRVGIKPGSYVVLKISDTGVGMDEDTVEHIFDPFFTTKSHDQGSGLGLSMVYGIIQQSGGYIDVTSAPDQGTTFEIFLPWADGILEPELPTVEQRAACQGEEIILLVEDEDVVRDLASRVLRDYGYEVLEARKGEEALVISELHQGIIHLLLTDVVMPEMSGRELAQELNPLRPDMKVLYMSGYTDDAVVRHGVQESTMPFLQKPFVPDDLVLMVRRVLDN